MSSARVCVVGGGIAAVSCAKALTEAGFTNVHIYEAKPQLGGRIATHYDKDSEVDPYRIELGANWIHGFENNPVFKIAKEHKLLDKIVCVRRGRGEKRTRGLSLREGSGRQEVNGDLMLYVTKMYRSLSDEVDTFFTEGLPPGYDHKSNFQEYILQECRRKFSECWRQFSEDGQRSQSEVTDLLMDLVHFHLSMETAVSGCHSMQQVSLAQFGSYKHFAGGDPTIGKGFYKVVECLVEPVPNQNIHLNTPVQLIDTSRVNIVQNSTRHYQSEVTGKDSNDSRNDTTCSKDTTQGVVTVTLANGDELPFDHVIFTGSLGHLKHFQHLLFSPTLPDEKQDAIERLGIGVVDKIFLEFENLHFLPESVLYCNLCWRDGDMSDVPHWTRKIFNMFVVNKPVENMLMFWITGDEAEVMESLSEQEVGTGLVHMLRHFFADVPKAQRVIRTCWGSDRFTKGSFSYIAVGATVKDVHTLIEPICDDTRKPVVQFAGEATHPEYYSTTHGALLSGEREALRLVEYYRSKNTAA